MTLPPKPAAHAAVLAALHERLALARAGMQAAQEASNADTKSSAGDKYETSRAMAQQERDRYAQQTHEAQLLLAEAQRLDPQRPGDAVRPGALVGTSLGTFYVGVAAGRVRLPAEAGGAELVAVSAAAPLMQALAGRRAGEEVAFNGRAVRVLAVS